MFCHVNRSCEWVMFTSVEIVKQLISKTKTKQWLSVDVIIDDNKYEIKKKIPPKYKQLVRDIPHRDDLLPNRNYTIHPNENYLLNI